MHGCITWRMTPKSKAFIAIVPPTVLPGVVQVVEAHPTNIRLQLNEEQVEAIRVWTSELPDNVMRATVCDTGRIDHRGRYTVMGSMMVPADVLPMAGTQVNARVTAHVQKIGSLYKTVIRVIDVLCTDIATI